MAEIRHYYRLSQLRKERRLDWPALANVVLRDETTIRAILERLVEAGLVEAHGVKKGRTYTLSAKVYRESGRSADYVRQVGFEVIQQQEMVLQYAQKHGQITRKEVINLCRLSEDQATYLLHKLAQAGKLQQQGKGRGTVYLVRESRKKP